MSEISNSDENLTIDFKKHGHLVTSSKLGLIILPTEQCNFRCTYCYEDFSKPRGMSRETIEGIKTLIRKRAEAGLRFLDISWFGGEPLLALESIKQIMRYSIELGQKYGITVRSDATTNGYLLNSTVLRELIECGVTEFQVSFDGDRELHNSMRIRRDGYGTFDEIWNNISCAHECDLKFHVTIRVHLNAKNYDSIRLLIERASFALGGDERFSFFIRTLSKLGGANDDKLPILLDRTMTALTSLREYAYSLGLKIETPASDYVCYASSMNSFVVRSDGRLGKCTVSLYDDRNTIGRLNEDGTVEIDKDKALWWSRGLFSGERDQLACPLRAR